MTGRLIGQNMYDLFEKVVDVVVPDWRDNLLSSSSYVARNMTVCAQRVISLITSNLSPDQKLLRS